MIDLFKVTHYPTEWKKMAANENENKNFSVVLVKQGDIQYQNRPIPTPKPNEAQVNVKVTGICGSDVHYWQHGRIGDFILKAPMVLGHESAGIVSAVGKDVKDLKVGDHVAIEPGVPCRVCELCKGGKYNLCPDMKFAATPPYDGTLTNYFTIASDFCHPLPSHVSLEEGALVEPLAVAVYCVVDRSNIKPGDRVIVFGAGPIGLLVSAVAKASGASHVTIVDINQSRIDFARTYSGNSHVLLERHQPGEDSITYSRRTAGYIVDGGGRADVTIDCSGAETCVQMGIYVTKSGGTLLLVGMGGLVSSLPLADAAIREVDVRGTFRYANSYGRAIRLIECGAVDVKPLITHRYALDKSVEAFELVRDGRDGVVKLQIHG